MGADPGSVGATTSGPDRRATTRSALDVLTAAALWGGMYVVSAATFERIPPVTLGLLRLVVGAAVLLVVFRGRPGRGAAPRGRLAAAGLILAATLVLQFVGTDLTGAAEGALLTTTTPAFVLLFAALFEGSRARPIAWAGVAVALAGVAVLAARNTPLAGATPEALAGDVLLVGSAAAWAVFSSVGRPLVVAVGAFRAVFGASLVAIVVLLPLAAVELAGRTLPPLDWATVGAVAYLGVFATAVAWSLWYRGYTAAPPTLTAALFFAQPVVGAVLGVVLLGEQLGAAFGLGAGLIAAGVLAIARGGEVAPSPTTGSATREGSGPG
jgi:drug/metabolite transporter (DMT)-like permease